MRTDRVWTFRNRALAGRPFRPWFLLALVPIFLLGLPAIVRADGPKASAPQGAAQSAAAAKAEAILKRIDWTAEHVPGTLLVGFPKAAKSAEKQGVHKAVGATLATSFDFISTDVVRIPSGRSLKEVAEAYALQAGVDRVELNYILHASAVPNDPSYSTLWGMTKIRAPIAWNSTTGSTTVVVGVIDSGIDYTHPDLMANMWKNSGEYGKTPGVDDDGNGIVDDIYGARWTNGDGSVTSGDPMDDVDHGTHVAGIIGATGNNGVGVAGVNWTVQLVALKFIKPAIPKPSGATADAIAAINYSIRAGARITNNSWGGYAWFYSYDEAHSLHLAIEAAGNVQGQLFVAAAGNDSYNTDIPWRVHYPSGINAANIVSVASSDSSDARSDFSNYGATRVDLAAPGSDIYSTVPGGGYASYSGTSMAGPHVAGVAALILARNPGISYSDLKQRILNNVDVLPQWSGLCVTGGRLNAAKALGLPSDDAYEPNNTIQTAYNLSADGQRWLRDVRGRGLQLDNDYYRIAIRPGTVRLFVDCRFTHSLGNIDLELYNAAGSRLAYSRSMDNDESLTVNRLTPGTYYIRVYGGNTANTYDLWWYDYPEVQFGEAYSSGEEGGGPVTLTLLLSTAPGPGASVSVDYTTIDGTAIAGQDFAGGGGTVTLQGAEVQKTFTIQIIDDFLTEVNETALVRLANPQYCVLAASDIQATMAIVDNDVIPSGARAFASYQNRWYTQPPSFPGLTGVAPVSSAVYGGAINTTDGTYTLAWGLCAPPVGGWADLSLMEGQWTGPGVTVNQASWQFDPTSILPVSFEVTFSVPVIGFDDNDADDVDVDFSQGTLGVTSYTVSGGPMIYTVEITGVNGADGTLVAAVPPGVCVDDESNPNAPSGGEGDNFVLYDTTPPVPGTVTSDAGPYTADGSHLSFSWSAFQDSLTGVAGYEVSLGTEADPEAYEVFTGVGLAQQHTFSTGPYAPGPYRCTVRATNGLGATSQASATVGVDPNTPTGGTVLSDAGYFTNNKQQLGFSWSGFTSPSGIARYEVALGTAENREAFRAFADVALALNYVFVNVAPEDGVYVCTVRATSGTGPTATASGGVTVDTQAPTADITLVTPSPTASDTIEYAVHFSEPVGSSFGAADVTPVGSLSVTLPVLVSGADPDYTVTAPLADGSADGNVGIALIDGSVTDLAGNPCAGVVSLLCDVFNWLGFTTDLEDVQAYAGEQVILQIEVNSGATVAYQWKWNDGTETIYEIGLNSPSFAIDPATSMDSGEYWCEVTYDGETHSSRVAVISIRERLHFVQEPSAPEYAIDAGTPYTFSAVVAGGFEPTQYEWRKDGFLIPGATDASYTISVVTGQHDGVYTLTARDSFTDVIESGQARLTVDIVFLVRPRGGWKEEGQPLTLRVVVAGTVGNVMYQWVKDGDDLAGATLAEYTNPSLSLDDTGWYWCRVTDESKGEFESPRALIVVFPAGSLPVAGAVSLCFLVAACATVAVFVLSRRKDSEKS